MTEFPTLSGTVPEQKVHPVFWKNLQVSILFQVLTEARDYPISLHLCGSLRKLPTLGATASLTLSVKIELVKSLCQIMKPMTGFQSCHILFTNIIHGNKIWISNMHCEHTAWRADSLYTAQQQITSVSIVPLYHMADLPNYPSFFSFTKSELLRLLLKDHMNY